VCSAVSCEDRVKVCEVERALLGARVRSNSLDAGRELNVLEF
jgi:hypothetical protein